MLTPSNIVRLARIGGGLGALLVVILTLGPFQGLEQVLGLSDKAAHVIAFYGLTVTALVVAPGRRRSDLAIMVLAFGVAIEILQGFLGRSASLADLLADIAGVGLAIAPGFVERLRYHVRTNPMLTFSEISRLDRRRHTQRHPQPSALPDRT